MTQTLPVPPPGAGDPVDAVDVWLAGIAAGAAADVDFAGIAGVEVGIVAGVEAGVADAVEVPVPYQVFTPLWPWHAPFLLAPE